MDLRNAGCEIIVVPPRWKKLVFALLYAIMFVYLWNDFFVDFRHPSNLFCLAGLLLSLYYVIAFGSHCMFTKKYLIICFLGLPVRAIAWSKINRALYVHIWIDPKNRIQRFSNPGPTVTGNIIYVTLKGCPKWHPRYTIRWRHNAAHPFRAFTIWLPYDRKAYFLDAFQKHYPDLERQPLEDWKKFG